MNDTTIENDKVIDFVPANSIEAIDSANDNTVRALSILASAILFAAPAFVKEANPQNILALADMFNRFAKGTVIVQQPSDQVATGTPPDAPKFG